MKILHAIVLGAAAALLSPTAATAADAQRHMGSGHYEWRSVPQPGPRSTGPVRKRAWVPDNMQMANCASDMMEMRPEACMETMHDMHAAPSVG